MVMMDINGRNRSANMSLKDIFEQCQEKKQAHNRLFEFAKKIYQTTPFANFVEEFERYLLLTINVSEPNPYVNNTLEFVAKFATSLFVPAENKENEINCSCSQNTDSDDNSSSERETPPNPFMTRLMKFLIQFYDDTDNSVRLHVCYLLNLLLKDMNSDFVIDDDLFETLSQSLLVCLKDKFINVRIEAVKALFRLQDPMNKDCPVTKQYLFHLKKDPNPLVREAILGCIGTTVVTLDAIIDRTRDEKEKVRKKAYELLADKVHIKALSISKRVRLLKEGLQDRSELVKDTVSCNLVPTWLKMCNGSIDSFLRCLDVGSQETDENLNVIKLVLDAVLENETMEKTVNDFIKTLNEEKVIPELELSCENAFYWKYLINYLQILDAKSEDNLLDQIQPELIHYCQYLKNYITTADASWDLNKKLDHQFICEQLLAIGSKYDLTDMAGSQKLNAIVNDIFLSDKCGAALVKPLISCIIKTKTDPEERLVMVAEIISNIREPVLTMAFEVPEKDSVSTKTKIAAIKVQLNELRQAQHDFADNLEFDKAQETKEQIGQLLSEKVKLENDLMPSTKEVRTERNDSDTLLKCVTMVTELMIQAPLKKMTPTLQTLLETLLVPGLHSPDPAVRKQGVLAVGLCSLINVAIANTYFVLFLQISQMDQPTIQLVALKLIFDLLHMHGVEMFQTENVDDENNESLLLNETPPHGEGKTKTVTNIVTILKSHLDSKYDDIRAISAQGLGKLLLLGHIYSSELLSHLILLWFNPSTDSNSLLFHFLGVFIPSYAAHGRNSKQSFEEAFIPSLITVLEAPSTSPLSRVNSVHMAQVLLELIQPRVKDSELTLRNERELDVQESKSHDRIAEKICLEILKDPENYFSNRNWSQILGKLYLTSSCLPVHKNIKTLISKINRRVRDKTTLRNIGHFTKIIDAILNSEETINNANNAKTMLESQIESVSSSENERVVRELSTETGSATSSIRRQKFKIQDSQSAPYDQEKLETVTVPNKIVSNPSSPLILSESDSDEFTLKLSDSQKKAKKAKVQVLVSKLTTPEIMRYKVSERHRKTKQKDSIASPNVSTRSQTRAEESFSQITTRRKSYTHNEKLVKKRLSKTVSQESSQKTSTPKNTVSQNRVLHLTRSGRSLSSDSSKNLTDNKSVSSSTRSSSQETTSQKSTRKTRTRENSKKFTGSNVLNTDNSESEDIFTSPSSQISSNRTIVASQTSTPNLTPISKPHSKSIQSLHKTPTISKNKSASLQRERADKSHEKSNFTPALDVQRLDATKANPEILCNESDLSTKTPISATRKSPRLNSSSTINTIPDSDPDESKSFSSTSPQKHIRTSTRKLRNSVSTSSPSPKRNRKINKLHESSFSEEPIAPKSNQTKHNKKSLNGSGKSSRLWLSSSDDSFNSANDYSPAKNLRSKSKSRLRPRK